MLKKGASREAPEVPKAYVATSQTGPNRQWIDHARYRKHGGGFRYRICTAWWQTNQKMTGRLERVTNHRSVLCKASTWNRSADSSGQDASDQVKLLMEGGHPML